MTGYECDHGEPRGPRYCAFCRRLGVQAKEEGQRLALQAVDESWREAFTKRVLFLAAMGEPFTVEDVIEKVGLPNEVEQNANNSVGSLMNVLARKGVIRPIGWDQAGRKTSHARPIRLWQGRGAA